MPMQLLLLDDVDDLGRSGDVVAVKPGYARNFLIPQRKAVVADRNARRMQARLQEERLKKASVDKQESEKLAAQLVGVIVSTVVKVDHEGHMYGSVAVHDIMHLLKEQHAITVERKMVQLPHAIKETGTHTIGLKLKEDVSATIKLRILVEGREHEEELVVEESVETPEEDEETT